MKTRIFNHLAILMMLVGNLSSCSNKMNDDLDPEKAILGKWELVLLTRNMGKDEVQHTPTGYIEYLPESRMVWYDYATKKYTVLDGKYWLEEVVGELENGIPKKGWNLHYQDLWIELEDGTGYCVYPDFQCCKKQSCSFISNNQMMLYQLCLISITADYTYVYKRKK